MNLSNPSLFPCPPTYIVVLTIKTSCNFFQRSIVQEATELKEKATNVEEALSDVNGFLHRLQDLAEEVSCVDVKICLVARHIIRLWHLFIFRQFSF